MEVVFIGTGGLTPRLERGGSALLAKSGSASILVDAGPGALHGLLRAGVRHGEIDAILLTHRHPDHVSELIPFFFAANYDLPLREKPLLVVGGPGTANLLDGLVSVFGRWMEAQRYPRPVTELREGKKIRIGAFEITAGPSRHIESSVSFRLESSGKTLFVTGDTGPCPEMAGFARGADLLVAEASAPSASPVEDHLTPGQAGELARAARAKRLILTHIQPETEREDMAGEAGKFFDGEVSAASDGLRVFL